jgi:predicted NodU family carbamoyl transferase
MYVLGLNGWPERTHDASACLVHQGRIVAFAEEERFTRRKHSFDTAPLHAAAFCLSRADITIEDVDAVAFGWDLPDLYAQHGREFRLDHREVLEKLLPRKFFPRRADPPLHFVEHHVAHAASSYLVSGHDTGAVLVLDGQGENASATMGVVENGEFKVLERIPIGWSLGYFYQAVCVYAGLAETDAGKLMGLAAYGNPLDPTFGTFEQDGDGYRLSHLRGDIAPDPGVIDRKDPVLRAWLEHLSRVLPVPINVTTSRFDVARGRFRSVSARDPFDYRDVAASAQTGLEQIVTDMVQRVLARTGERVVHLAGGVAFNASLNGKLVDAKFGEVFVQPVAGDAGVSLGAAVYVADQLGDSIEPMGHSVAWGPDFGADEVRTVLERAGIAYAEPADIAVATAEIVSSGGIVAWHQGRSEVGPRALGQRSILADPRRTETRNRINLQVKQREWWRPLAPSMDAATSSKYLEYDGDLPFMVVTAHIRPDQVEHMRAVAHVDGTTRPQTVSSNDHELYHRYLMAVQEQIGHPISLNTSFNSNEEPVVCTPEDALRSFARMPLDALAIGPFLIRRTM